MQVGVQPSVVLPESMLRPCEEPIKAHIEKNCEHSAEVIEGIKSDPWVKIIRVKKGAGVDPAPFSTPKNRGFNLVF